MSTKDEASLDRPSNGQSLVVHQGAPLGTRDMDWGPVSAYARGQDQAPTPPSVYLHAIRRHWLPGLLIGVILAGACGVGTWFLLPKRYTARSGIQVSWKKDSILPTTNAYVQQQEYEVFKATQAQLLRSPVVLMAAVRKPGITDLAIYKREAIDAIGWLRDDLSVGFPADSEIMQVSLTDKDGKEVTQIVRAVVESYLSEIVETERNQKARELTNLAEVLSSKEREIRAKRTALKQLADELGTADGDTLRMQLQFATQQLSMHRQLLSKVQIDARTLNAELQVAQTALKRLDSAPVNAMEVEKLKAADWTSREHEKKLSELVILLQQARGRSRTGDDPLVEQLTEQVNSIQTELNTRLAGYASMITEESRNKLTEVIADLTVKTHLATEEEERMKAEVAEMQAEFEKLGQSSVDLEMMRMELDNLQVVVNNIATRKQSLEVETKSQPRIRLLNRAEEPPTYDNFTLNAALAVFASLAGLSLPLASFVLLDVRKQRINSSEDVAKGLGLPVMGSVPMIPGRAIKHLNSSNKKNQQWNIRLAESIDGIAAKLLRNAAMDQNRVVLITSAVSGEGKTTLATQAAMSLARAGKRVVLVDFDLRRPAIDKAFQLPLHPGVSEALCGESTIEDLPQATSLANLEVITAGRCDRHALQALANGGDKRLFDALRERYEFVIVDGSPILPVADSRYVSQHVDSVVLSVFRDFSRAPKVTAACEILEAFGVTNIEAVVTSSSEDGYGVIDTVAQPTPASA